MLVLNGVLSRCRWTWSTHSARALHWEQLGWCCGESPSSPDLRSVTSVSLLCLCGVCNSSSSSTLQSQCLLLRDYIHTVLGPFIRALRADTQLCSLRRCHGNGRCTRQRLGLGRTFSPGPALTFDPEDVKHFTCQCYWGWTGQDCQEKIQN